MSFLHAKIRLLHAKISLLPDEMPYSLTVIEGVIVDILVDAPAVPTMSEWGLVTMAVLLLIVGTVALIGRRQPA